MFRLNNIKQNLLIVALATFISGCGGGSTTTSEGIASTPALSSKAIQEGQVIDRATGRGLANVEVNIESHTTTTDANGFYRLNNIAVNDNAVVNFEKDGYLFGSTKVQIKALSGDNTPSTNYLEYTLDTYNTQWSYDSQDGSTSAAVEIPAGTIHTDESENVYNGVVYSRWLFKDTMTAEGRDAFPGAFEGMNNNGIVVPFVSYGLMSVELKDENGASLSLSENITLALPSVTGTTENILSLWYYDYDQGLWIEDGFAERQSDGTYLGEISHPGTWSLSQPIEVEVGIYRGYILNVDGSPMSDARVYAVGDNWISSDLSTDQNGQFELEVIPGNNFQLSAYNYKDQYEATYNGIMPIIASGNIVEG
ncbi:carboxypeptidase-like regulatory domain-containing protein [Sulfurovum sp. AR]|uniref:carboxypeptidase-like regulatory domain-containing protein n=1 Tax=Sulfurovum sp. AR TaxID=1165841 RepID=UPI00025C4F28|nr:carboxypeptidase-like regulatory domain-containing protein [Sulfurovum sp. AR]EIF51175.1 hypothetical protein SULAR_04773 [Sulfurovum sp. AR]